MLGVLAVWGVLGVQDSTGARGTGGFRVLGVQDTRGTMGTGGIRGARGTGGIRGTRGAVTYPRNGLSRIPET